MPNYNTTEEQQEVIDQATKDMAKDWDERAQSETPFYYIATHHTCETEEGFRESGKVCEEKVFEFANPILSNSRDTVLEIGCGVGRALEFIAPHYRKAYGVDVSQNYLNIAKDYLKDCSDNIELFLIDGVSLPCIEDNSIDLTYCIFVIDHIPHKEQVELLLEEVHRVLKKDGAFILLTGVSAELKEDYIGNTWCGAQWTKDTINQALEQAKFHITNKSTCESGTEDWEHYWTACTKEDN